MTMPTSQAAFTVDTNLFRELGELLVGRNSMALIELVKNAYDADATRVVVVGENLHDPERGRIVISDNGIGMTEDLFRRGFLTIASRHKQYGDRRSARFKRRYTGEKGVGRLATFKLAGAMSLESLADSKWVAGGGALLAATIDWDALVKSGQLDSMEAKRAVSVATSQQTEGNEPGTRLVLERLKGRWTDAELKRMALELNALQPPQDLIDLDLHLFAGRPLVRSVPLVRDASKSHAFECQLQGDLDVGDTYGAELVEKADWIIEVDSTSAQRGVLVRVAPKRGLASNAVAEDAQYTLDLPSESERPCFYARILIRGGDGAKAAWTKDEGGIKVYLEGFRVPPYGESRNDWLGIDSDYTERSRSIQSLGDLEVAADDTTDLDEGLSALRNRSYRGAVFMTRDSSVPLRPLVNREGFVDDAAFDWMRDVLRKAIGLSVRVRNAASANKREQKRRERAVAKGHSGPGTISRTVESRVHAATELVKQARSAASLGDVKAAADLITTASNEFTRAGDLAEYILTEPQMMRSLAGVGTQVAALVHEVRGLLGITKAVERTLRALRRDVTRPRDVVQRLSDLQKQVATIRSHIERQAHYLQDLTSPDSRRRRSRQPLAERLDASLQWFRPIAEDRGIEIDVDVPTSLKTGPMFPAELGIVLSNLLSNALKAAGHGGRISVSARTEQGSSMLLIQNTGNAVDLATAEKWFQPFQSSSDTADASLGHGMGMGLPIARGILEDVNGSIAFVEPDADFATAIRVSMGKGR